MCLYNPASTACANVNEHARCNWDRQEYSQCARNTKPSGMTDCRDVSRQVVDVAVMAGMVSVREIGGLRAGLGDFEYGCLR